MNHSPIVDVFGSYFPAWMLCLVFAILLTIGCRAAFRYWKIEPDVGHPALIYPSLTVLFTCLLWLNWFR